jgi:hypothetical protein
MSLALAIFTAVCLFGSFMVMLFYHLGAPEPYRSPDSIASLRLGVGVVATLSTFVLGLMISSVKTNFDTVQRDLRTFSIQITAVDHNLREYGPAGEEARAALLAYAQQALRGTAPSDGSPVIVADPVARGLLDRTAILISGLQPSGVEQSFYVEQAKAGIKDLIKWRLTLISEYTIYFQPGILTILIIWLCLLFGSFGYGAPRNRLVVLSALLAALTVASAVFLMVELDSAFDGIIAVSDEPLRSAVEGLKH